MKLDLSFLFPQAPQPRGGGQSESPGSPRPPKAREGTADEARLSIDGEKLRELGLELSRAPEVRRHRVETIQQALRDGSYQVTSHQIAEVVFSELLDTTEGRE